MDQKETSDQNSEKTIKPTPILNALVIGFMFGIIVFSVAKNTVGLFTLVPLYFIYRMIKQNSDR